MDKVNPFPALTAPRPLTFLSNLPNTDAVALVANLGKTYLAKGTARSNSAFLPNEFRQLSFTKFYICRHIVSKSISYFSFLSCC